MYICIYDNHTSGKGESLLEAYKNLFDSDIPIDCCEFYEARELQIEIKIEEVKVPVTKSK